MISLEKIATSVNEKGAIPVGIGILIGYLLVWGVHTGDMVQANALSIEKVKEKQKIYNADMHKVNLRLSRIEWALKIKVPKEDEDTE